MVEMMSLKREDYEQKQHERGPMTKRIKSPILLDDQLKMNHYDDDVTLVNNQPSKFELDDETFIRNNAFELAIISELPAQVSSEVSQNRKRRTRAVSEEPPSNPSTNAPVPLVATNTTNQTRKKSDLSCVVCCGLAHGYNFDAISCESCKAFFRRNALFSTERLKCRRDGACEITLETRRRCKSCRLKKCFAVGMRKEWILTEEEKTNKKIRIEENRRLRIATLADPSGGTHPPLEPTSPSEKLHLDLQSVVLANNRLQPSKSSSFIHNADVIANVMTAFNDGFQLDPTSYGWSYPLAKKVTALCQILNTKNTTALRLISFYKRLVEFDALDEMDKVNLVKNNLPYIFIFHGSLGYDPVNDIYHEGIPAHDTLLYGADIQEAHGDDIHTRCTRIMRSLHSIVQLDRRIIQMALIIMLFAKGLSGTTNIKDSSIKNHQRVFQAQNFYIEHLWLFMEKYYGTVHTIRTFSTLISRCLLIQGLLRDIEQDIHEKLEPYQVPPIIRTLMNLS